MKSADNEDQLYFFKTRIQGAQRCGLRPVVGERDDSAPELEAPLHRDSSSHRSNPAEEEAQMNDRTW